MNAGPSPDIGTGELNGFIIAITEPPVVEIDTEATAAYVRFSNAAVSRTEPYGSESGLVMLDFDVNHNLVGIEIVGQQEFSIRALLKHTPITLPEPLLERTRYVAAELIHN